MNSQLKNRAASIDGIVFDVDGVLTDGRIVYSDDGSELKQFHVQDGASIKLLMQHNIHVGIITGRQSTMVERRARELGINWVKQGVGNKAEALTTMLAEGFSAEGIAVVGDDLQDLTLFEHPRVLLNMTVANAHPAVLERAHFITSRAGGEGVAVEICQLLLMAQDKWEY
ncbi:MAG: HAD hydrolase family protein [Pseudomonadota bacterium]